MATETRTTVSYKGRNYLQLFRGKTKFGEKCKLAFLDGSKEFWVDANLVSPASTVSSSRSARVCAECGKPGRLVRDLEDGLHKHYRCCDMPPDGY